MAHNIDTMAYAYEAGNADRSVPWHGLGAAVTPGLSTDEWLRAAGLEWGVKLAPVQFSRALPGGDDVTVALPTHNVLYRDDSGAVLDIVGDRYVPIQNDDILNFFREYADAGAVTIETAGALRGGKYVWALASLNADYTLPGGDVNKGYVLLANPHVWGEGLTVKLTHVRVVCNNTYTMALRGAGESVRIPHTKRFDAGMAHRARVQLGIARDELEIAAARAERFVGVEVPRADAVKVFAILTGGDATADEAKQSRTVKRLLGLLDTGAGASLASAQGTAWGVFNAVTEWTTHIAGRDGDRRLADNWLGTRANVAHKASEILSAYAAKGAASLALAL